MEFDEHEIPWSLIASALQGELSPEENDRFGEWLAASPANRALFERMQRVWKEGMTDYDLYRRANADRGWGALQGQIAGPAPVMRWRWAAAAAALIVAAGAAWWGLSGGHREYTAAGVQQSLTLADGTTVVLQPRAHLRVAGDRKVILLDGEATFDVIHHADQPFVVDMDAASIMDVGTRFCVAKTPDSIEVRVTGGKIRFTQKETEETRTLTPGDTVCLYTGIRRKGQLVTKEPLRFDDAPLSAVIDALRARYGKDIRLTDTALAAKKLTVHLDGVTLAADLQVVCASLNLSSEPAGDGYVLKNGNIK